MRSWTRCILAVVLAGCQEPTPPPAAKAPATTAALVAEVPHDDQAAKMTALTARESELIKQVLERYEIPPESVDVKLSSGLLMTVTQGERTCERQLSKDWVEAELITNFDHMLDYCVREIMKPLP